MVSFIPRHDREQALRIKRLLMGFGGYGFIVFFFFLARQTGFFTISISHVMIAISLIVIIHLGYYIIIRSGLNLRFKDPSLTMIQMASANTWVSYLMLFTDSIRGAVMIAYITVNLFGIFQLNRKEFIIITIIPLLQYGLIILWLITFSPPEYSPRQDIIQWIIVTACLSWLCMFGTYIKNIRIKLEQSKAKLSESHGEVSRQRDEARISRDELEASLIELENTHHRMENFNRRMVESIDYAEMIQRSLLPGMDRLKTSMPDSFFVWIPKDIVGGDIFYTYRDRNGFIIVLMDCTGQGVPGAFMTMIAYSEARKIILDEACHDPAEILKNLNHSVKAILKKDTDHSISDEGLDAAVCRVNLLEETVTYAGAGMPLFYIQDGTSKILKGDRQNLGFKDSDPKFCFTNHTITVHEKSRFYLTSDGYLNQPGGMDNHSMGIDGFLGFVADHSGKPYDVQRKQILQSFFTHRGAHEQADDVTVIGFGIG